MQSSADVLLSTFHYSSNTEAALVQEMDSIRTAYPMLKYKPVAYQGTLPVTFQCQEYSVPIRLTYVDGYPKRYPAVNIMKEPGMVIRSNESVAENGVVVTALMKKWKKSMGTSVLLQDLAQTFSKEMPVDRKMIPERESIKYQNQFLSICNVDDCHSSDTCCICAFPLTPVCQSCYRDHMSKKRGLSFHFLLPITSIDIITSKPLWEETRSQISQLDFHQKELRSCLDTISAYKQRIEAECRKIKAAVDTKKETLLLKLQTIHQTLLHGVDQAITETSVHALDSEYCPKVGSLEEQIWLRWKQSIELPLELFQIEIIGNEDLIGGSFQMRFESSCQQVSSLIAQLDP